MIEISDRTATEIQGLFRHFISATAEIPRSNKMDNARRVAGKIIKYIEKKNEEKETKRDCNPVGVSR